jgi:hypothetical protein
MTRLPATAFLTAALLFTGACGAKDAAPKDTTPSPSTTTPAAQLIDYGDEGVPLRTPDDVAKLHDAPEDFKQFIAGAAGQVMTPKSATDKCGPYLYVNKVDTSGYAGGGVFDCGGAQLMWARRNGLWQEIWGGQTVPGCDDMKKFAVPKAIVGDRCWDGKNEIDYAG